MDSSDQADSNSGGMSDLPSEDMIGAGLVKSKPWEVAHKSPF